MGCEASSSESARLNVGAASSGLPDVRATTVNRCNPGSAVYGPNSSGGGYSVELCVSEVAAFEPIDDFAVRLQLSDTPPDAAAERGLLLHLRGKEDDRRSFASVIASLTLRRELVEMERVDQAVRMEMIRDGVGTPSPELLTRMAAIDVKNTRRLQEIVAGHGWPSPDLVGQDGAGAAFILLQHASYDAQKALFPLVEAGYRDGTVPGQSYALLLDSILVWEGKPQVYGSKARPVDEWVDGEPTFWPIDDEADVDRRRAEVGLSPLAEYREMLKRLNFPDE
jgi:hypothetical protein